MPQHKGDRTQASGKRRGLKFWLLTAAAASVFLGILVSALLPLGIQWGMKKALVRFGAESVEVENIDFNAFTGRLVIFGLEFNGPEEGSLSLDRLIVDLDLLPTWKKRIKARHVSVIGLTFDVIQPEDGELAIGGFPIAPPAGKVESPESDKRADNPWGLGMGMLDLNDIHVRFSALGIKEDITLDRAQLSDFHSWSSEKTGQLDVSFMFNGGLIQIMGEADLFGERPTVTAELKVGEMPMGWLIPYLTSEEVRREVGKRPLHRLFPALENYDLRTIEGELWFRSKLNIQLDRSTGGRTASLKSSLTLKDLDVTGSLASIPVRYREKQFIIDSTLDYGDEGVVNPENIRVTAASTVEEMRLDSVESGRNILSVDLYRLTGLTETGTDLAEAERVYFEGIKVLEGDSGSHAINVKGLELHDIRFSDLNRLEVAEIAVNGLDNLLALDSNGSINIIRDLKELAPESSGFREDKPEEAAAGKMPMTIKIDRISVSDGSRVRVHDSSVTPAVEMSLSPLDVEITNLDSAKPDDPTSLAVTTKFGEYTDLDIRGTVMPFASKPTLDLKATVRSLDLPPLMPYARKNIIGYLMRSGSLDGQINLSLQYDPGTGSRTVSAESSLTLKDLDVTGSLTSIPVRYRGKQFVVDTSFDYRDEGSFNPGNIRVTGASTAENMRLDSTESGRNLLSIDLYRLSGFKETGRDLTEAGSVYFEGVKVLEEASESHAINFREITVNEIRFSDLNRLEVGEVDVKGVDNLVARDSEGNINLIRGLEEILPKSKGEAEEKPEGSDPGKSPVTIKIDRVSVTDGSRVRVQDASVTPAVEMSLSPLDVEITNLDSAKPDDPTSLAVTSKFGKYSDLDVHGTIKPFASKPTMDLKVTVRSLDLPPLTPYSKKNIGHLIKSGHLDADIHWRIDQGNIDSQVNLLLHKFRLEAVDETDEEAFSEKLDIPVPVNLALSMLRDKNDNIDLKLPITGNMEAPEFQLRNVMYKAVGKAMTAGAVGYFGPLGLQLVLNIALPPGTITLAGVLADQATKLRFEALQFVPLEYQPTGEHEEYLDKLAQLIQDRPGVELVFCGISTSRDLAALRKSAGESAEPGPDPAGEKDHGLPAAESEASEGQAVDGDVPEEMPITDEERSVLQGIAKNRALAVKDYLVEHGVDSSRLLICFSEFEDKQDAAPRVEVAL